MEGKGENVHQDRPLRELAEIMALREKATPGPWRWNRLYLLQDVPARDGSGGREENPFSTPAGRPIADDGSAGDEYSPVIDTSGPDAQLIVAAVNLLPTLEKLVAKARLEEARWWADRWDGSSDRKQRRVAELLAKILRRAAEGALGEKSGGGERG